MYKRQSETSERLAKRLAAAVERSCVAPAAAEALGNSFGAADCHLLGKVAFEFGSHLQKHRRRACRPQHATRVLLPERYHEFLELKQEPDCSGFVPLQRVALVALLRFDLVHQGRCSFSSNIPIPGRALPGNVSVSVSRSEDTYSVDCSVAHRVAWSSPSPGLCLLPAHNLIEDALLGELLSTPAVKWRKVLDKAGVGALLVAAPSSFARSTSQGQMMHIADCGWYEAPRVTLQPSGSFSNPGDMCECVMLISVAVCPCS